MVLEGQAHARRQLQTAGELGHLFRHVGLDLGLGVVEGGGHQILVIGSEGADCVPYFARHGISTVILRERLRIDGYDMTTDAMDDTFQAIRLVCVSPAPPLRHHTVTN